jgi:predicted dehydrogenase
MTHPGHPTRRSFLHGALGAGAALAAGAERAWPAAETSRTQDRDTDEPPTSEVAAPTERSYDHVRVAFIGVGGIGGYHMEHAAKLGVSCPCFCDVDRRKWSDAGERFPGAKAYQDYRQMFEREAANFDAVMIGVPDHSHYPATMLAFLHDKHVYTQKPLTHTVWEARQLAQAARKHQLATQMGNQGHANEGWRLVYEWIRGGALGDVQETHTWTDRPIWPQGMERSQDEDVPSRHLDWDLWVGPAPMRPYRREAYHPFNWRGWWDFGAGALGDMACHTMDGVFWALDPGPPTVIEPLALSPVTHDAFPKAAVLRWEFPARGERPAFRAYWYDGALRPRTPAALEFGRKLGDSGTLFLGTKASLLVQGDYGDSPRIFPESLMKEIGKPAKLLERSPGHVKEWIMAVAGEVAPDFPKSNFAYAGQMTETILLGNIALRMGRRLEWDAETMQFTNLPQASEYVTKEYRSGWKFG